LKAKIIDFGNIVFDIYIRTRNDASNETYKEHKEVHLTGEVT